MYLTQTELDRARNLRDLTNPHHGDHAMQLIVENIRRALHAHYAVEPGVYRTDPVVKITNNYDRLRICADSVSRDRRYTRYVNADHMLRSHTSAGVPAILDDLSSKGLTRHVILCPGLVYRRDQIDRTHTGEPHQMDIWLIQKDPVGDGDLVDLIHVICEAIDPGLDRAILEATHPYTLRGKEIYLGNLEIGECGIAHPDVLAGSGLGDCHGLAMGIGLDRILMLLKGIDDIRLLRSDDDRVSSQMHDLDPYRPVSMQPAAKRDLSLALSKHWDLEILGGIARQTLGDMAEWIEDIQLISQTPRHDLPDIAKERLGIKDTQINALIRIIVRHPTHTLTSDITNRLRYDLYMAWHEGDNDALA